MQGQEVTYSAGSSMGSSLQELLCCDEIVPGADASYSMCKTIYLWHPLGQKIAESPIRLAMSDAREVVVTVGPEEEVRRAFLDQWEADGLDTVILNVATQARVYGIASVAMVEDGRDSSKPLDLAKLAGADVAFSVFDPLNTSGSLVLNQNPNAFDFQKQNDVVVQGQRYHRSRTVTLMNEAPIYIAWSNSAFGFVGRSVYQRALFPLKSFVQTMRADDMVARKVGLIVATLKMATNVVDRIVRAANSFKRSVLRIAETDNVISIGDGEKVESLDLTNLTGPLNEVRSHILENIAAADDMPAKMLNNETFAAGFGEGTEDAKRVAAYLDEKRKWMRPVYVWADTIVQRRAWTPDFFAVMQKKYPDEYAGKTFDQAFYEWANAFTATWPSLLREPESEEIRVEETKFKTVIATGQVLLPECDPENRATVVQWMADCINESKKLFPVPLVIDQNLLLDYMASQPAPGELKEPDPSKPFGAADSGDSRDHQVMSRVSKIEHYLRDGGRRAGGRR